MYRSNKHQWPLPLLLWLQMQLLSFLSISTHRQFRRNHFLPPVHQSSQTALWFAHCCLRGCHRQHRICCHGPLEATGAPHPHSWCNPWWFCGPGGLCGWRPLQYCGHSTPCHKKELQVPHCCLLVYPLEQNFNINHQDKDMHSRCDAENCFCLEESGCVAEVTPQTQPEA